MKDKNCLLCQHCYLSNAQPGYSEYTPSSPMTFQCSKNHWNFDEYSSGKQALSSMLSKAEECEDFEIDASMSLTTCPVCFKIIAADQKGNLHDYCSKACKKKAGK